MARNDHSILIVEDTDDDVFFIRLALKRSGIATKIEVAPGGLAAVSRLEKNPLPSLVLSDLNMRGVSGFDLLSWRIKQPHLRKVPFVVLTSSNLSIDRAKALSLGADDCQVKPASIHEFTDLMKNICHRYLPQASIPAAMTDKGFRSQTKK